MPPHPNQTLERRFILSLVLTGLVLVAEVLGGFWTGSLALLSDAAHVFMDVFALGLSYLALRLSALPADDRHTYGYHRLEVFAALLNGATLGLIAVEIFREAWQRWQNPAPIKSVEMLVVAIVGLIVNLWVARILSGDVHHRTKGMDAEQDLNVRSAYLHVLGDAISSMGVILAAVLIRFTNWLWLDPLVSVFIGILIVVSSWRVLKSSLHVLMEGVPEHLSLERVKQSMASVSGVLEVHDLHVWSICSGHIALSAHVVLANQMLAERGNTMTELKERLSRFGIEHTTIQFECEACGREQICLPEG